MGYLYILQSRLKLKFYIGSTIDLGKRVKEHNNGYVISTKYIRPLELKFFKKFDSIQEARGIEYKIKKLKSRIIVEQIVLQQEIKL
jgi:predicted GIY-YIG superfamily endonuclease